MHFTRFSVLIKALITVSLFSCTLAKASSENQIAPRDQESPKHEARDLVCVQDLILHDLEDAGIQGIDFCLTFIVIPQITITIPSTSTPLVYTTTTINSTSVATQNVFATSTVTATEYNILQVAKRAPSPTPTLPAYLTSLAIQGDFEKRPALMKRNASQDSALASSVSSACSCLGVSAGITLFTPVAEPTTISLTAIRHLSGSAVNQTAYLYTTVTTTVISTTHTARPTSFSTETSGATSTTATSSSTESITSFSSNNTTSKTATGITSAIISSSSPAANLTNSTAYTTTTSPESTSTTETVTSTVSPYGNNTSTGVSSTVSLETITSAPSNITSTLVTSFSEAISVSNSTLIGSVSITSASTSSLPTVNSTIASSTSPSSSSSLSTSIPLTGCPLTNLTIVTTTNGDRYQIQCGIDYPGDDLVGIYRTNLQSCAQLCSNTDLGFSANACIGASFVPDAMENKSNCYLKRSLDNPTYNDDRVSLVQLGNPLNPNNTSNNTMLSSLPSPTPSFPSLNSTSITTALPTNSSIHIATTASFNLSTASLNISSALATEISIEASSTPYLNISITAASATNSSSSALPTSFLNYTISGTSIPHTNSSVAQSTRSVSNSSILPTESSTPGYNLTTESRSAYEPSCNTASTSLIYVTSIITSIVPTIVPVPTSTDEPIPNPLRQLFGRHSH